MNAYGRSVDTTCLSTTGFLELRGVIARDYAAHCFRFSHVYRYLQHGKRHRTAHVLDVGCGREAPLPALMFASSLTHTTGSYTAVDYGIINLPRYLQKERESFHATWLPKTDFITAVLPLPAYDVITFLEVVEHVEPLHAFRMLQRIRSLMPVDGAAFISTPCYDSHVGAAKNHVNEMTYDALRGLLGLAGLRIDYVRGTFASQKSYAKYLLDHPELKRIFDLGCEYYDSNVMACFMAPLLPPELARNCLWRLGPADVLVAPGDVAAFLDPSSSSSALWADHARQIYQEVTGVK